MLPWTPTEVNNSTVGSKYSGVMKQFLQMYQIEKRIINDKQLGKDDK